MKAVVFLPTLDSTACHKGTPRPVQTIKQIMAYVKWSTCFRQYLKYSCKFPCTIDTDKYTQK